MKMKKSLRVLLPVLGACVFFAVTAIANDSVRLFINGEPLQEGARVENGETMAPVRALAEAMGGSVTWDKATHSVNIKTGITKDEVSKWLHTQGEEKSEYYFDGLFVEEANVDRDSEPEVLARIDGGVHLGNFFIFDKQYNGSYKLIFEQPWHVESWSAESFRADGIYPLYKIVTRTGGTGIDVREAHLMYMSDAGAWTEAWKGTLIDRAAFQDYNHMIIGSYQFDDNGMLFYWQTEADVYLEKNRQLGNPKTTTKMFELQQGRFVEKE